MDIISDSQISQNSNKITENKQPLNQNEYKAIFYKLRNIIIGTNVNLK